jgi:hypothetical protein
VDYNKEWIWAAYIETMPIQNDRALRAALSRAVYYRVGQAVFTAIYKDSIQVSVVIIIYY